MQALLEARRIGRPGAVVAASAISRWAPRLHRVVASRLYEPMPHIVSVVEEVVEIEGRLPPLYDGSFTAYTHRPDDLRGEVQAAGLEVLDLVGLEGLAFALPDLADRMADVAGREIVLSSARALQRVPELLGMSPHLLVIARVAGGPARPPPATGSGMARR